jgi:hypothetical protein
MRLGTRKSAQIRAHSSEIDHQLLGRGKSVARKPVVQNFPKSSPVYSRVADYIREMGASDQFVVKEMLRAKPEQMNVVNGADVRLCQARVATWIQRSCEASR